MKRPMYLYPGVHIVDVWDAAKDGLDLLLCQDGPSHLSLLLQRVLEELGQKGTKQCDQKVTSGLRVYVCVCVCVFRDILETVTCMYNYKCMIFFTETVGLIIRANRFKQYIGALNFLVHFSQVISF